MGHVGFFPEGEGGGRDAARRNRWDCPSRPLGASRAAARNNVPAVYASSGSAFVRDGGLLSYGPDPVDNFRRAATYVDRILRGDKPGDLPVQFPTKFEMVVNRKTAGARPCDTPIDFAAR